MKIIFTLIVLFFSVELMAQKAGTLDSSFGTNGKVVTSSPDYYLQCIGTAPQSDGSIIAAGGTDTLGFFAVKYNPGGKIDSSFGINGFAAIYRAGYVSKMAVQPDDKILVAGYYAHMFGPYHIAVARFTANGSIDSTFGTNGLDVINIGNYPTAMAVQPDGKILIEGHDLINALSMRLLPDGTFDSSFGTDGVVETAFSTGYSDIYSIAIQPEGKIVVGGTTNTRLFFGRYNANGTLDESFGSSGSVSYQFATGGSGVTSLILQPDGKIVAVGNTFSYFQDTIQTLILRTMPDGHWMKALVMQD